MRSYTTRRFRQMLAALPPIVQQQARDAYLLFAQNPQDPGLRFKQIKRIPLHSARAGDNYRAVAFVQGQAIYWFWIGTHREYEKLIARY